MLLTHDQLVILKASILENTNQTVIDALAIGSHNEIADFYNTSHPTTIVWKTNLSEHDIVSKVSSEGTTWDWTAYISTSTAEKMAWERMFNGTFTINPSLPQVRSGIAYIFRGPSGSGQRTHLLAVAKRNATYAESLYTAGTGTSADPGTLSFEGGITYNEVSAALFLP